ncbi:MAG TPA: amidohydrolase [Acidimicrobiales bacterium]|nr:amidohydrolase [Acidimicrobiales bacterium]
MNLDLVVFNARVYTMNPGRPTAKSLGIWRGRVAGLDEELEGVGTARLVDAGGRTVLPGFVDAHTHLVWQGLNLGAPDISAARGVDDALALVEAAARDAPPGWLDVSGYDQRLLGRHLEAADLDRVSHGHKVYVRHVSGHACVVSSAVLREIPGPELEAGPGVARRADGGPTGLFLENAQEIVLRRRLPYGQEELRAALRRSSALCAAQGVTFCAEAGTGAGLVHHSPVEPAAYQDLSEQGELAVRVQLMVAGDYLHPMGVNTADSPSLGVDLGLRTGFGGERLSLGAAKFWLDGGMSARTAALSEPYAGSADRGSLTERLEHYRTAVPACHAAGWQLALHAIGDSAIDEALELVETATRLYPRVGARPRIEHCGLVRPDQLERLARSGVIAVVQPEFLYNFGEDYSAIVGPQRAGWLYRGRSLLDHGVVVAGSSDRPVTAGSPLTGVSFMVTRRTSAGHDVGPAEAMSVGESLHAYTAGAAYACRAEHEVGSLGAGKQADLVILDADPFQVAPADISAIPVVATMVGGRATYDGAGLFSG